MKTKISIVLVIALAILSGCGARQKETVPEKPTAEKIAPGKSALDSNLTDLTNQITNSLTEAKRSRIAIAEFYDLKGNIREFGIYVSEELITRLSRTSKFDKVVERQSLNKIMEEHNLSYRHFFDDESVKEVGKLLGADAIALGLVSDIGRSVIVNARLIDTETGAVFAVAAVEISKDKDIEEMWNKIVKKAPEAPPGEEPRLPEYVWEDGVLRVTVASLKKTGTSVTVLLSYENISDKPIKVDVNPAKADLLDENGERWRYKSDTARLFHGRNILPGAKIRSRMTFTAKDSTSGSMFDLFLERYAVGVYEYSLAIQNIKAN